MGLDYRNTNTMWASVLVETLVRLGLRTAVVSPGSRSTPLTVAFAAHPQVEAMPVLDERSAAFLGLGLAKRTGLPTVLVCTSGTAGANYYPALSEAHESRVPLLVLTADRPPELRDCASGQTIDQQKLFGDFPNAYLELALPEATLAPLRYLRQTLCHAWNRTLSPVPGPVHVNCPFRDPLAPVESAEALTANLPDAFFAGLEGQIGIAPLPRISPIPPRPAAAAPLIIAGPAQPPDPIPYCKAIAQLAQTLQAPVLAEGLSPLRNQAALNPYLITTYDLLLRRPNWAEALQPDWVIQVGPLPTSKVLRQWLETPDPLRWVVDGCDRNLDPLHDRTVHLPLTLAQWVVALPLEARPSSAYADRWTALEARLRPILDQQFETVTDLCESKAAWLLSQTLPPQTPLFIANSLAVRDVEWFWPANDRGIQPFVNRGANGIDGTLSTALGVAHRHRPAVLLTGDLALLHDTNGFLSVPKLQGHLTIVLVNNSGGGIFERLPIANFEPPFEDFFATPQQVDFSALCRSYGVAYEAVTNWAQLADRLRTLPETGVRVLEVRCDRKTSHALRESWLNLALDLE